MDRGEASAAVEEAVRRLLRSTKLAQTYVPEEADDPTGAVNAKGERGLRTRDVDRLEAHSVIEEAVLHIVVANDPRGVVDAGRCAAVHYAREIDRGEIPAFVEAAVLLPRRDNNIA